jgi:SpoVK/Ycf46/Vps4 family AAA+-type ATPase
VDLPGLHDRKEILQIHLASRGRDIRQFDIDALAKATEKYSGAEIEAVVIAALFNAFSEGRELTPSDMKTAIEETVPLAVTMEEEIRKLRDWAKTRTRPAAVDTRRADLFGTGG